MLLFLGWIFLDIQNLHWRTEFAWTHRIWQSIRGWFTFVWPCYRFLVINRPGLAGAVLQSSLSLFNSFIHSWTHPLVQISSKYSQFQTGKARKLKFCENVHPTICVLCHVSFVTCYVSHVTCHMSRVPCQVSHVTSHMSN